MDIPIAFRKPDVTENDLVSAVNMVREWKKRGKYVTKPISPFVYQKMVKSERDRRTLYSIRCLINSSIISMSDFKLWLIKQMAYGEYPLYCKMPWNAIEYQRVSEEFSVETIKKDTEAFAEYHRNLKNSGNVPSVIARYKLPISYYAPYSSDGFSLMWSISRDFPTSEGYPEKGTGKVGLGFYLRGAYDARHSEVASRVSASEMEFRRTLFLAIRDKLILSEW